jgi:hypothetical protein
MKKNNPFKKWQVKGVSERKALVTEQLKVLDASNAKFESKNKLAIVVAKMMTTAEELGAAKQGKTKPKPVNKTTLTRNKEYDLMLLGYMAGHPQDSESLKDVEESISEPGVKVLVSLKDLQISNLTAENKRLHAYLASLNVEGGLVKDITHDQPNNEQDRLELMLLSKAIIDIVSMSFNLEFDHERNRIIRTDRFADNVVVDSSLLKGLYRVTDVAKLEQYKDDLNDH